MFTLAHVFMRDVTWLEWRLGYLLRRDETVSAVALCPCMSIVLKHHLQGSTVIVWTLLAFTLAS